MSAWHLERNPPLATGLFVGVLLLVLLGLIAFGLIRTTQAGPVRCYTVSRPYDPMEKIMMAGQSYDCIDDRCWAIVRVNQNNAVACFFPRWTVKGRARAPSGEAQEIRLHHEHQPLILGSVAYHHTGLLFDHRQHHA